MLQRLIYQFGSALGSQFLLLFASIILYTWVNSSFLPFLLVCINAISPSMVETLFLSGINTEAVELTASKMPHGKNLLPS